MARAPILPANPSDPTGVDKLERGAIRDFSRRIDRIRRAYVTAIDQFDPEPVVNKAYTFRLDQFLLSSIYEELGRLVDAELLQGGEQQLWLFETYVGVAYQRGTAQEFANLAHQSPAYRAGRQDLAILIRSDPYQRRIALLRAREFEEMKGLSGQVKADMGRILSDGMARGLNPREIAKNLDDQAGIEERRAARIARTEVPTALRRARMDEADDAAETYGTVAKQMHMSALSPTTRPTHAKRHAKLFTTDQQREWWAKDGNSINCYLPGTKVQGRFEAGSKAHYRGEIVEIVTASGRNLSVTPNHPVLTSRGMVTAAEIRKGDYTVAHCGEVKDSIGVSALDNQHVAAQIEDVFASLVKVGHSLTRRVNAVDFHGDGASMDEDVSVVVSDGPLAVGCNSALSEKLDHLALIHANPKVSHVGRAKSLDLISIDLSAPGVVSRCGSTGAELSGESGVAKSGSVSIPALSESVLFEKPRDADSGESDTAAELLDGFTGGVPGVEVSGNVLIADEPLLPEGNAAILQPLVDGDPINPKAFPDAIGVFAGDVAFDEVIDIRRREYFGHVYDLQEKSGLMCANGLIASNCKCSTVSVLVDDRGNPLVPAIVDRARKNYQVMKAKGKGAWTEE